ETAVERRIATCEDVEIDPVQDDDLHRRTLVRDQLVQRAANFGLWAGRDNRPVLVQQHESQFTTLQLLVALKRGPGTVAVDRHRSRCEHFLDDVRGTPGEPKCGE